MQRTPALSAIFASLLSACIAEPEPDPEQQPPSNNSGCGSPSSTNSETIKVTQSEYDTAQDEAVNSDEVCEMLCTPEAGSGSLVGCEVVDGAGTMGGSEDGAGDSSDTTGADGSGTGMTGADQSITLRCDYESFGGCLGGRGHEALCSVPERTGDDTLGTWLASMAHSEEASVTAFLALSDELRAHGAPSALVQRAREAAKDEVEHAEAMTRLAQRRGTALTQPRFGALTIRDLEAIATENAVEGCVRETWAALTAGHQAQVAADPELREVMATIAVDETRHAQLSHDLHRWICTRLDDRARARVEAAQRQAVAELEQGLTHEPDPTLRRQAGLPGAATATALCRGLRQQLWS